MVDLAGYETRDGAVQNGDAADAVNVLVFDFDGERAGGLRLSCRGRHNCLA